MIEKKCALQSNINECKYFDGKDGCLSSFNTCSMILRREKKQEYVRQPRWYEKYYK